MTRIPEFPRIGGLEEIGQSDSKAPAGNVGSAFADTLKQAMDEVDRLQHDSESSQVAYARGDEVELHDVLIKIEEAEIAFKTMMEVRNKLVEAYREVMRMGSGG